MINESLPTVSANPLVPLLAAAALLLAAPSAGAQAKRASFTVLPARQGPVVTDEQFFAALDLARPGLEAVRAAVEKGDLPAAKAALAAYYRGRTRPVDPRAPIRTPGKDPSFSTARADALLRGEFSHWLYPDVSVDFTAGTDWALLPVDDREWAWVLNRHHQWNDLAEAYIRSGDERYARAFNRDLASWVRYAAVPEKSAGSSTPVWRTIEAGIRLGQTWMPAYHSFLASPSFTDEVRILFYKSILEHARFLRNNPSGGNWLTMEMNGLLHAAILFPEFKESAEWREYAFGRLSKELDVQVYPDGAQFELTTAYHNVALGNMVAPAKLALANNVPRPVGYFAGLEKMYVFDMYMAKPNGGLPAFNDSDPFLKPRAETPGSAYLREGADLFRREDFRYVATQGAEGSAPKETSFAFPYAGFFVMRSGWDADARYLALDAGPFGAGHQHEDKLSFELAAYDRTLLVDPGRGAYAASPFRSFFVGAASHNTVMVDGLGQNRRAKGAKHSHIVKEPLPNVWISAPGADYVEGVYDEGYGPERLPVTHRRRILFVKPGYWLVADRLDGEGAHTVSSLLHFNTVKVERRAGTGEVRTLDETGANISVRPLHDADMNVTIVGGETDPVQGWIAPDYDTRVAAPAAIFEARADLPFGMGMVLCPAPAGGSFPAVTRLDASEGSRRLKAPDVIACRLTSGIETDDVYLANDDVPTRRVFSGHVTDGGAAILRRTGGKLRAATLLRGATLSMAGKSLIALDATVPVCDVAWEGQTLRIHAPGASGRVVLKGAEFVYLNGSEGAFAPSGAVAVRFGRDGSMQFVTANDEKGQ